LPIVANMGGNTPESPATDSTPAPAGGIDTGLLALLHDLEQTRADGDRKWTDKRTHRRQRAHLRCEVRYVAPDGHVRAAKAVTRDLSQGGVGLISDVHFRRRAPLVLVINAKDGTTRKYAGLAAYSREVRTGWYLTGVQFGAVDPALLNAEPVLLPDKPTADSPRDFDDLSGRVEALKFLESFRAGWTPSKERTWRALECARSADHVVRRAAVPVLMQLAEEACADALIALLNDSNSLVQCDAAAALGELKERRAIARLQELLQDPDDELALRVAHALAQMQDASGMRVVSRIVGAETPLNRRAARTLGLLVGMEFRPNAQGVAAARAYLNDHRER
jgi:hypothetical protein